MPLSSSGSSSEDEDGGADKLTTPPKKSVKGETLDIYRRLHFCDFIFPKVD